MVHAPAGYGKTVALTQWAAASRRDGLWVRVREGLGEPASFAEQLASELDDAGLLDESNPLRMAAETLAVQQDPWTLVLRGLRRLPGELTLVLDEGEHLDDATIAGILQLVADAPRLTVRVATRRSNRFTEPGLALSFDVQLVSADELALTGDEATRVLGGHASADAVAHVLENGASPALARIVVLAGTLSPSSDDDAIEAAVDSLLRLRAPKWDERFVSFFERISLTETIDARLAAELTGEPDAGLLLDRAEAEGLGYWSTPGGGAAEHALFVIAPVFRRIAERSARRHLTDDEGRELDLRIARWHLAARRALPALQGAVRIRDWDLVNDVVRMHWPDLIRSSAQVRELFRRVPPLTLRTRPLPSMLLAILWNAHGSHRLRALEYLALASYGARMQRGRSRPADRAMLLMVESTAQRISGRHGQATRTALACYDVMLGMRPEERSRLGSNATTIYNHIGLSMFYGGHLGEALDCFRRSEASSEEKGRLAGLQGLAQNAGALSIEGDIPEAEAAVARATARRWPDAWRDGYPGSLFQLARTLLALEEGDLDEADAALSILDAHRATIEHWGWLEHADALIRVLRGDAEGASLRLERVEADQRHRQSLSAVNAAQLHTTWTLVELARGDLVAAERFAARLPPGPARDVARARVWLAQGDTDRVVRALAVDTAARAGSRIRAERLALVAAALALDEKDAGNDEVTAALLRLQALLLDRKLRLPVVLLPGRALDAMRRRVSAGGFDASFVQLLDHARARTVIDAQQAGPRLTRRELTVARELTASDTVTEIAAALSVSPNTIKSQLRAVYRKLGVSNREDALRALAARGLTDNSAGTR